MLFQVLQIENGNLASQDRVVDLPALVDLLQLAEFLRIGEGFVDPILGLDLFVKVFILAGNVGVPPGEVSGTFERPNLGFMSRHEFPGALGHFRATPDCHRRRHQPNGR